MGNFEVSVALFVMLLALFQIGDMLHWDCSKINKASDRYVLFLKKRLSENNFIV
jgi:hypothetical protein